MRRAEVIFLRILKAALNGQQLNSLNNVSADEWKSIFQLAEIHSVLPLVYQVVYQIPTVKELGNLRHDVRQLVMLQTMKTYEFQQVYHALREAGLKPLLVKGLVCRQLYPNPDLRLSSDEDLLIKEEEFSTAHACLTNLGMYTSAEEEQLHKEYEIPYYQKNGVLYLEVHKSLFPPEADAYGDWNSYFDEAWAHCIEVEGIYTLSYTDHLFYLLCHAFKHFIHSGFGIRQVCDIVMYANAYGEQVDWKQIYENCCQIHAEVFAAALFRIGHKYLTFDFQKAAYPQYWQEIDADEQDMLQDLLRSGVFGGASMSRKHSSNITLDAVTANKQGKKAKVSLKNSLFPSMKSMEKRYPYLKKQPYLLPVAWINRILKYSVEKRNTTNNSSSEALKIGSQRVELLKKYRIIQ